MLKMIVLILSALNMQIKAAAAKAAEPDVKTGKQRDVKEKQDKRAAELKEVAQAVRESTGLLPELVPIITGYEGRTTVFEDMKHLKKDMFKLFQEFLEHVREHMPTREWLASHATTAIERAKILYDLTNLIFPPDRVEVWHRTMETTYRVNKNMVETYKQAREDYGKWFKSGLPFHLPCPLSVGTMWQAAGFSYWPTSMQYSRFVCKTCKAEMPGIMPWQQPQYYHKSDCKTLAAQLADPVRAPHMKIVAYGQDIPEDPEEYWHYTIGFLERHALASGNGFITNDLFMVAGFAMLAQYIKKYNADLKDDTRKAQYESLQRKSKPFRELWKLGSKKAPKR